jgi:protoheme ferro-lyase
MRNEDKNSQKNITVTMSEVNMKRPLVLLLLSVWAVATTKGVWGQDSVLTLRRKRKRCKKCNQPSVTKIQSLAKDENFVNTFESALNIYDMTGLKNEVEKNYQSKLL